MSNGFRLVCYVCSQCGKKGEGMMQVSVGEHLWDCDECGEPTYHDVSEVEQEGGRS